MNADKLEINKIYNMKDIDLINRIEKNSIDAVITDPPYFIDIKGKVNTENNVWDSVTSIEELVKQSLTNMETLQKYFMFKYNVSSIDRIILNKEDKIYIYFYTYLYNLISSNILKDNARIMIFNTYDNCMLLEDVLNQLSNDFNFIFYEFTFFEYTKYNPHPQSQIERTSEYLIHVNVSKDKYKVNPNEYYFNKETNCEKRLKYSESYSLRDKEIYDAINITKGYYVPDEGKKERIHDTQKPPRLLQYLISNFTKEDDVVLDTFSGSGSIPIACFELNRQFIASELSNDNYKSSIERLEYFKNSMPLKIFNNNLTDTHFAISNAQFKINQKYNL